MTYLICFSLEDTFSCIHSVLISNEKILCSIIGASEFDQGRFSSFRAFDTSCKKSIPLTLRVLCNETEVKGYLDSGRIEFPAEPYSESCHSCHKVPLPLARQRAGCSQKTARVNRASTRKFLLAVGNRTRLWRVQLEVCEPGRIASRTVSREVSQAVL